jgi:hypothetical protein
MKYIMKKRQAKATIFALIGLLILAQPVVGNGPGPETQYTYEVELINLSNDESVEVLFEHPAVAYQRSSTVRVVRNGVNETFSQDSEIIAPELRDLIDRRFFADDDGDQYYRVDARITNGTFKLDATPVSERAVVDELGIPLSDASSPIRVAVDGDVTSLENAEPTIVADEDRALLVRIADTESVPDRLAIVKIPAYALGVALVIYAGIKLRE